jgi:hypothetical protein
MLVCRRRAVIAAVGFPPSVVGFQSSNDVAVYGIEAAAFPDF